MHFDDTSVTELKDYRRLLQEAIDDFPTGRREEVLFGDWSLKDVIAHINAWDMLTVKSIDKYSKGLEPMLVEDLDDFNLKNVNKRKIMGWDELYEEFVSLGKQLVAAYESIDERQYDEKIWPDKDLTPRKLLRIEIDHYKDDHLPEIQKFLV